MQCLSRRVLLESRLPEMHEVRKDRVVPNWLAECWRRGGEHGWWQVYLGNFISCEVVGPGRPAKDGKRFFDHAHTGWDSFGILCAVDKDVEGAGVAHELGAEIDGELGKVSGGTAWLWQTAVCSLAVALMSKRLNPKRVQVLGGVGHSSHSSADHCLLPFRVCGKLPYLAVPWLPGGVLGWSWYWQYC